jgi:hypothetical protein
MSRFVVEAAPERQAPQERYRLADTMEMSGAGWRPVIWLAALASFAACATGRGFECPEGS